ncbi:hypothetical protein ACFWY5_12260 [Nonomuraea sp. NPDC059007]|uniref:hypothetical protein n=1 Tax=Nonomuraea sp. NPDC059007 TaxID=3346692 RepID=UPI0036BBD178
MQPKTKVELYAAIRRDSRAGLSIRAIQSKHNVGFRTVEKALASVWPEPRKSLPPRPSRLDPFKPLIDQMLRADLDAPPKQRHTARRIFDRLVEENDATEISYGIVRVYVAKRRPQIRLEAGRASAEVFIEQSQPRPARNVLGQQLTARAVQGLLTHAQHVGHPAAPRVGRSPAAVQDTGHQRLVQRPGGHRQSVM